LLSSAAAHEIAKADSAWSDLTPKQTHSTMNVPFRVLLLAVVFPGRGLFPALAQKRTVIPFTEAIEHVGQQATVEGVVAKVFTSRNGNTFLDYGAAYPNELFTGWIPRDSAPSAV
jgi:hypothetical protein